MSDFWEEGEGVYLTELSAGTYDVLLSSGEEGMPDQWLRNVSVQGGRRSVHEFSFPGIGELELRVLADGEPCEPGWLNIYDKNGNFVTDLSGIDDGVYFGELPEGIYDAVAIFEDDSGVSEVWLYDIRIVANQKQKGVIQGIQQ